MNLEENCAWDEHGNLKDASKITFYNSPSDNVPLPPAASSSLPDVPDSPTLLIPTRAKRIANQEHYHASIVEEKQRLTPIKRKRLEELRVTKSPKPKDLLKKSVTGRNAKNKQSW